MPLPGTHPRSLLHPAVSWGFLAAMVIAAFVYLLDPAGTWGAAMSGLITVGAITAGVVGMVSNRPFRARCWALAVAAQILWAVSSVIRAANGVNDGEIPIADLISFGAYACIIPAFWMFARGARGRRSGIATDMALVATGAALVGWIVLVVPTLHRDRTLAQHVADVAFPTLDAVLLTVSLRLVDSHRRDTASSRLFTTGIAHVLVADLMWGLDATEVLRFPVSLQMFAYLIGFGLAGAAALHPTMRELGQPLSSDARPLGTGRAAGMAAALVLPTAAALIHHPRSPLEWVVVGLSAVVLGALTMSRALQAVRENERSEDRLRYQASHDPLTGLPNRWSLMQRMGDALGRASVHDHYVGLLHADLDKFSEVNDTWGHAVGDELLIAVANRLRGALPEDVAIATIGGGSFALLVETADRDRVDLAVALVARCFDQPFPLEVGEVFCHCSIGVTVAAGRRSTATPIDLLREADTALHRAKALGAHATVLFEPSMSASSGRRLELERGLRRALDNDELEVHYQPVVNLRDGRWEGVEALVRWRHPEKGLIPPGDFIPLAEENGLIVPLGARVLEKACRQLAEWRATLDVDWSVSVNLSVRQLRDPEIAALVRRAVSNARVPADKVWIELTESLTLDEEAGQILSRLRDIGVRLVMDDFGTGYSSLGYLKRLPIDRVKIDRSFVVGLGEDPDSAAIIRAVLGMTSALRLACVAEGIETDRQRRLLMELGCHYGQGYLFSRPMAARELTASYLLGPSAAVPALAVRAG